jgi:Glyoxalase-like domain
VHHSRFSTIIIDCKTEDLATAARFWSQAFGRVLVPDPTNPTYISLGMRAGEPLCQVQAVSHESRVHLDIETDDLDAEVKRLGRLGAKAMDRFTTWVVMQAPTGQRFCVGRPKTRDFPAGANRWK